MTREAAKGNLIHAIRWNNMPSKEALEMAIIALEQEPCADCISRQQAIEDVKSWVAVDSRERRLKIDVIEWLKVFPPA